MTMTHYEVRNADGAVLCSVVTDRAVSVRRNRERGVVSLWATVDPAEGFTQAGVDPTDDRPLVLVSLDEAGKETARAEVAAVGVTPPGWVTRDRVRPLPVGEEVVSVPDVAPTLPAKTPPAGAVPTTPGPRNAVPRN